MVEYYPQLSILNMILVVSAAITMGIVCSKRKDLKYWFITYLVLAIGVIISSTTNIVDPSGPGHLISRFFYIFASITILIAVFKEYFEIFFKGVSTSYKINSIGFISVFISTAFLITILEVFIILLCGFCAIMSIRISFKKKTFTHAFLSLSLVTVTIALIFLIMRTIGIEGMGLFYYGINLIFFNTLLITSIVALLDKKLIDTLNEKNFLKDKYSHDLGNILHTITMSYDVVKRQDALENKFEYLDQLIKSKILEASNLVKDIRNL